MIILRLLLHNQKMKENHFHGLEGDGGLVLRQRSREGFTLMELSIVLVIIGLLVGGIMVGKEMIRSSQLQSILKDLDKYNAAILVFKDKYKFLPGDLPNATQFWGVAHNANDGTNHTSTCFSGSRLAPIGSTLTCNGNGNGAISGPVDDSGADCQNQNLVIAITCDNEPFAVWHQLANAGLVGGTYISSISGADQTWPNWVRGVPGGNMPSSSFNSKEGFALHYVCNVASQIFSSMCGNTFFYGAESATFHDNWQDFPIWPVFTVGEASGIDAKIDDGKPGTGGVTASKNGSVFAPSCATNATTYNAAGVGVLCALAFKSQF